MKNLVNRAKHVCGGEEGIGTVEVVIMVSIALIIGVGLYFFGDNIVKFLTNTGKSVGDLNTDVDKGWTSTNK